MPYFTAVLDTRVSEIVVVEAENIGQARVLIDDDDDSVVVIRESQSDFEIRPGSLSEALKQEVEKYLKYKIK